MQQDKIMVHFVTILCMFLHSYYVLHSCNQKTLPRNSIDPKHRLYFTMVLFDVYHSCRCKLSGIHYALSLSYLYNVHAAERVSYIIYIYYMCVYVYIYMYIYMYINYTCVCTLSINELHCIASHCIT